MVCDDCMLEIKEAVKELLESDACLKLLFELCLQNPGEKYIPREELYNKLLLVIK